MRSPLFRRRRPSRRATAVAAALALAATGLAVASPAQALPLPINDDFEGSAASRWSVSKVPGITDVAFGSIPGTQAHSGTGLAWLNAFPEMPATATIFRTITLDTAPTANLRLSVWTQRSAHQNEAPRHSALAILRIREGGTTGRIISTRNVSATTTQWTQMSFTSARPAGRTFTVEIGAYQGTLLVDDLSIVSG